MDNQQDIRAQMEVKLRAIADSVLNDYGLPKGYGFTMLMFDYGEGGNMMYVSTAKREDMLKAMKEFMAKNEPGEIK